MIPALHIPACPDIRPTVALVDPCTLDTTHEPVRYSRNGGRVVYAPRDGGPHNPLATHLTRDYHRTVCTMTVEDDVQGDVWLFGLDQGDPAEVPVTLVAAAMQRFDLVFRFREEGRRSVA